MTLRIIKKWKGKSDVSCSRILKRRSQLLEKLGNFDPFTRFGRLTFHMSDSSTRRRVVSYLKPIAAYTIAEIPLCASDRVRLSHITISAIVSRKAI